MPITCLIPMDGSAPVAIDRAVVLFGRQSDCDVVLQNSRKVSRKHCCIAQINGELLLRDLGSMNGIRLNGKPVENESWLKIGDELFIGDVGYRVANLDVMPKKQPSAANAAPPVIRSQSQDPGQPRAIPEEGVNFKVEETAPKLKPVFQPRASVKRAARIDKDEAIELSDDDLADP